MHLRQDFANIKLKVLWRLSYQKDYFNNNDAILCDDDNVNLKMIDKWDQWRYLKWSKMGQSSSYLYPSLAWLNQYLVIVWVKHKYEDNN